MQANQESTIFLKAFEQCESLSYPLPAGITNYGIAELVYGRNPEGVEGRDLSFELPDFAEVEKQMNSRKNMTLVFLWDGIKTAAWQKRKNFIPIASFATDICPGVRRIMRHCISML